VQAQLSGYGDDLDEEVGALSSAVNRLKGMAAQIGEEAKETGKIQDAVARQLEAAQVCTTLCMMGRGTARCHDRPAQRESEGGGHSSECVLARCFKQHMCALTA
jgi:hypothetical protein